MATKDFALRTDPSSGKQIVTFKDTANPENHAQGMALVDGSLAHSGISTNPAYTREPSPTTTYLSDPLELQALAKSGAGVLRELVVTAIVGSPTLHVQIFDQTAALVGAETPAIRLILPASGQLIYQPAGGWSFTNGCRLGLSSKSVEYLAANAAYNCSFYAAMD